MLAEASHTDHGKTLHCDNSARVNSKQWWHSPFSFFFWPPPGSGIARPKPLTFHGCVAKYMCCELAARSCREQLARKVGDGMKG